MKAEERKALQHNDLEAGLEKVADAARHGPPRGFVITVVILALLIGLFFVWRWLARSASTYSANQLVALAQMTDGTDLGALNPLVDPKTLEPLFDINSASARRQQLMLEQLQDFVQTNPRSLEGRLARLRLARLALYLGERDSTRGQPYQTRAKPNLELARDQYALLVNDFFGVAVIQQEAQLNQARALETLGQIDEALELYRKLAASPDQNSPFVVVATKQVERLEKNSGVAKSLYNQTLGGKSP